MASSLEVSLQKAAAAVRNAKALIVTAGAGMGVDSGLPDFRGEKGFWKAYPLLQNRQIKLSEMSNPDWFQKDPTFAWWFFGHRYNMYSSTEPHEGFQILKDWGDKMEHGYFAFTSNVDGHFQRAGFDADRVMEVHGTINFMQNYGEHISNEIWPVPEGTKYELDMDTMKLVSPLPIGPPGSAKQNPARPNILMFGDWLWISDRTDAQEQRMWNFQKELEKANANFVVIEIGAGLAVPTVRYKSESLVEKGENGILIRINPMEPEVPDGNISLPIKGLEALKAIKNILDNPE